MSFFNKKEDVIEIQLTQYGKYLLSKGKFKPSYYAFFDDDIIYDSLYAGATEEQNDIQPRIEDTPRVKTQYTFSSREMEIRQLIAHVRSNTLDPNADPYQPSLEKDYSLINRLGNSMIGSDKNPSWSISFYKGVIENLTSHIYNIKHMIKVPQIKLETVEYQTKVLMGPEPDSALLDKPAGPRSGDQYGAGTQSDLSIATEQYADGSYVSIEEDYLLIDVMERNVDFENDNFDIEVYLVEGENTSTSMETLHPLKFIKQPEAIKNGILLDEAEGGTSDLFPELDPTYVEYWFDISCDHEIVEDVICKNRPPQSAQGNIYTKDHWKCPEKPSRLLDRTGLAEEDLGDFCDD